MKNFEIFQDKIGTWDDEHQAYFLIDKLDDQVFYSRRPNARFRNGRNRSTYHNRKNREERRSISEANSLIYRNYSIIKQLYKETGGVFPVPLTKLYERGFSDEAQYKVVAIGETGRNIFYYHHYGIERLADGKGVALYYKSK